MYVVGNKNDLYGIEKIKKSEAEEYTKSIKGVYRCVSALNSTGINELFDLIGQDLLNNQGRESVIDEPTQPTNNEFTLKKIEQNNKENKRKCC